MKQILIPLALFGLAFSLNAQAGLSPLNASCPGKIDVRVAQGGLVYVNGRKAALKRFNENFYEAKDAASGVTISIMNNAGGPPTVSYTGKNRSNGMCTVASARPPAKPVAAAPRPATKRETHPASETACLAAVSKKVGLPGAKLSVIEAMGSEAGILVKVRVPGADAPWACMTDQKGKPWNVSYSGSEGKL